MEDLISCKEIRQIHGVNRFGFVLRQNILRSSTKFVFSLQPGQNVKAAHASINPIMAAIKQLPLYLCQSLLDCNHRLADPLSGKLKLTRQSFQSSFIQSYEKARQSISAHPVKRLKKSFEELCLLAVGPLKLNNTVPAS